MTKREMTHIKRPAEERSSDCLTILKKIHRTSTVNTKGMEEKNRKKQERGKMILREKEGEKEVMEEESYLSQQYIETGNKTEDTNGQIWEKPV